MRFLDPQYSFPLLDPFNDSYCPSRHLKLYTNLDGEYKQGFKVAIDRINNQQPIIKLYHVANNERRGKWEEEGAQKESEKM